jgi:hypothetical protein
MKKQINLAFASFVIAFALIFAGARPVAAQNDEFPPDQDQQQAQPSNQVPSPYQNQDGDGDQDPSNRVAQLNYTTGSVSFQPGGQGDWVDAVQNRPLTSGDNLWADQNSRAELHVGSTALRIDSQTSLTFLTLNDQMTQLRLSAGALIVRIRNIEDGTTFEVDTPNLAFDIQSPGEYRIDVNADGNETLTTVWQGRGEVSGGGDSFVVNAGEQARFSGTDQLEHETAQIPESDDFDNWAFQRDQQEDRSESAKYISPETTGYEDLDQYGSWHQEPDYGAVWTPSGIGPDWAPYQNGHWVWIDPWGWTWVETEPWGFAPFHYGRWAFIRSSWCWVPGPVAVRPVYSPAFVAFVGGGGGFSLSVGVGGGPGVGWFPLAPGEVYVPWYRTSRAYVNRINVSNTRVQVTQITNVYNIYNSHNTNVTRITYVNQRDNRGVTVVSRDTFVNARPVRNNIVRVDAKTIVRAPVTRDIRIQPGRPSVVGAARPVKFRPPEKVISRPVVATRPPVQVKRQFEAKPPQVNVRTVRPAQHPGTLQAPNRPAQPGLQGNQQRQQVQQPNNNQPPRPGEHPGTPRPPNQQEKPGFQGNNNRQQPNQGQQNQAQPNQGQSNQGQQPGEHPGTPRAPNQPQQPGFRVNQNPQPLQNPPNNGEQNNKGSQNNIPRPPSTEHHPQPAPNGGFQPMNNNQQQPHPPENQQNARPDLRPNPPPVNHAAPPPSHGEQRSEPRNNNNNDRGGHNERHDNDHHDKNSDKH